MDIVTIYDRLKQIDDEAHHSGGEMWAAEVYSTGIGVLLKEIAAAISTVKIERRHVVHLELQGDTWDEVTCALDRIVSELQTEGPPRGMTSGGVGAGFILFTRENKDQTHDRYVEQLREFLKQHKASNTED